MPRSPPYPPNQDLLGIEPGAKARAAPCIHLLGCPGSAAEHLFGPDGNVRDLFTRVVYGAQVSLVVGFVTVGHRDR